MARPQEKPAVFTAPYSPISERETEAADDYPEAAGGCGCFRRFCFGFPDGGESYNHLLQGGGGLRKEETWAAQKFKKLKELSEVVAGPKWKNLIRKIGKFCNPKKYNSQTTQFHYSPESYAMNFAGDSDDDEEDGNLCHSFSSRFAAHALLNDQQRRNGL